MRRRRRLLGGLHLFAKLGRSLTKLIGGLAPPRAAGSLVLPDARGLRGDTDHTTLALSDMSDDSAEEMNPTPLPHRAKGLGGGARGLAPAIEG